MILEKIGDLFVRSASHRLAPFDSQEHVATVSDSFTLGKYHYTFRPYIAADMHQILYLARRAFTEEQSYSCSESLDEDFIKMLRASAGLIRAAFSIEVSGKICGFVRYCTWTNVLLKQRNFENLVIYIAPEYRSFALFKRLNAMLERAAIEVGADQILLSFDNGIAAEQKRIASEKIGYETIGAFLGKALRNSDYSNTRDQYNTSPSLRCMRHIKQYSHLSPVDFMLYALCSLINIHKKKRAGTRFIEYADQFGALAFARTLCRIYDKHRIALVTILHTPNEEMMRRLHEWGLREGCAEIIINTKELGINPCDIFVDYHAHDFLLKGYILRKTLDRASHVLESARGESQW